MGRSRWRSSDCALGSPLWVLLAGSRLQLQAESARLRKLFEHMAVFNHTIGPAIKPDPDLDADGSLLRKVWEWRRQRMAAISKEVQRIEDLLSNPSPAVPLSGPGAAVPVADDMADWIVSHGGEVRHARQATHISCVTALD
jgi:hypothetical protein